MVALMEYPANYDCHQLHKSMARIGTVSSSMTASLNCPILKRENVLIEILTTRTNEQIQQLKYQYKQVRSLSITTRDY